jgi:hypothetical protein
MLLLIVLKTAPGPLFRGDKELFKRHRITFSCVFAILMREEKISRPFFTVFSTRAVTPVPFQRFLLLKPRVVSGLTGSAA